MTYKRFSIYPMKRKPISPRRAREFKDRWSKRFFGDRQRRAVRWMLLPINHPELHAAEIRKTEIKHARAWTRLCQNATNWKKPSDCGSTK